MFRKNGYGLKSDARKILKLTNELYQDFLKTEESQSIRLMWNEILGDNVTILVSRFSRHGVHFGFKVATTQTELGYQHEITEVINNTDVSQHTNIEKQDILLEINGINLFLLNYEELAIILSELPKNVQMVHWKKENDYEKLDMSHDDKKENLKRGKTRYTYPINIIVQRLNKKQAGLEFINNAPYSEGISSCVIQSINTNGYFFKDKRISLKDFILRINNIDVRSYQVRDMNKFFHSNKSCVFLISIVKCGTNLVLRNSELSHGPRSQSYSLEIPTISENVEMRNSSKSRSVISSPTLHYANDVITKANRGVQIPINLDKSDDLGIYLVDMKEGKVQKSVICDFRAHSKLKEKLQIWDEIIKINGDNVEGFTSIDIGKLLRYHHQKNDQTTVTVYRGVRPSHKCHTIVISSESDISNVVTPTELSEIQSMVESKESVTNEQTFHATVHKVNNSFGLFIQNNSGPTITRVVSNSELCEKDIIRPGDKIVRINDIYVLDKDQNFVLTLIRSCGKTMNLEILRIGETDNQIEDILNPIYHSDNDAELNPSNKYAKLIANGSQSDESLPLLSKSKRFLERLDMKSV